LPALGLLYYQNYPERLADIFLCFPFEHICWIITRAVLDQFKTAMKN